MRRARASLSGRSERSPSRSSRPERSTKVNSVSVARTVATRTGSGSVRSGVTERSAVLKGPNGLTTLTLLPDVAKHDLAADRVAPRVRSNRQPTRIAEQRP